MKNTKLLSKLLTIILSVMMIFSSVLVANANNIYATDGSEEEIKEILEEKEEDLENKEETPAESEKQNDSEGETTNKVEETPEQPEIEEEIIEEEIQPVQQARKSGMVGGILIKTNTITFLKEDARLIGNDVYATAYVKNGGVLTKPENPEGPEGTEFYGWYLRVNDLLTGKVISETEFTGFDSNGNGVYDENTGEERIYSSFVLFPKFILKAKYEKIFDFKVRGNRGNFVQKDENGVEWSYYSYYDYENNAKLVETLKDFNDFAGIKDRVKEYKYVMTNDQVRIDTIENEDEVNDFMAKADKDKDGKIDTDTQENEYESHAGEEYSLVKNSDGTYTLTVGTYYKGTAFDIAIQEAPEDSEIVLLTNFNIYKPIEIWGNIDLNLNDKTIRFDEFGQGLEILHLFDRYRTSDIVIPKDITYAIYADNAKCKIYNGKIVNAHTSGGGVLCTSDEPSWNTTIDDLIITVQNNNNAIQSGYYYLDSKGQVVTYRNGYIDVLSGKFNGYLNKIGSQGLLRFSCKYDENEEHVDIFFKNDPTKTLDDNPTNVLIPDGYQVWHDGPSDYPYTINVIPQVEVTINGNTKKYRYLESALVDLDNGSNDNFTIKLLQNRVLRNNFTLPLNLNKTYSIDTNGYTLDGCIEIMNGNVTLKGSGTINNVLCSNGTLNIIDGHYSSVELGSIEADAQITGTINITGGNFKEIVNPASGYMCIENDMPDYKYCVVETGQEAQASATYGGNPVDTSAYLKLTQLLTAINKGDVVADTVIVNRDCTIYDVIAIEKPITLDLNNKVVYSDVKFNNAGSTIEEDGDDFSDPYEYEEDPLHGGEGTIGYNGVIASVYVDTKDSIGTVTIKDGKVINITKVEDNHLDTVYGIYNKKGNLSLNSVTLIMQTQDCETLRGIYNGIGNSVTLSLSKIYANETNGIPVSAKEVTFVENNGTLMLQAASAIEVGCDSTTNKVVGVNNTGNLSINTVSWISVASLGGSNTTTIGVKNSGNIEIANSGRISVNNNDGKSYGIYGSPISSVNKTIKLSTNAIVSVQKVASSNTATYGIYVEYLADSQDIVHGTMNVILGKCVINIGSRNTAYGIYALGGKVIAGTIAGQLYEGVFNATKETVADPATTDNSAQVIVKGGNNSTGIACSYNSKDGSISQLTNTYITLEKDTAGSAVSKQYCVACGSNGVGVEVLGGYYYGVASNSLVSSKVNLKGGYYSKDVTTATVKNYQCIHLDTPVTYSNSTYSVDNIYEYQIKGSSCKATATVTDGDDGLDVIIKIKYDPYMLKEPTKYGVKINVDCLSRDIVASIDTSMGDIDRDLIDSNFEFVYKFSIPAKLMSSKINLSIVDFKDGQPSHTYHSVENYSVMKYYYNMLSLKKDGSGEYYSQEVRDLAAAALNFGAYAQLCFANNVEIPDTELVNYDLDKYENFSSGENYSREVQYNSAVQSQLPEDWEDDDRNNTFFTSIRHDLSLDSLYSMRYIIGLNSTSGNLKFYCNGEEISPTMEKGLYYIDINGIASKELEKTYDITIEDGNNKYVLTYNPISYIYEANKSSIFGEELTEEQIMKLKNLMNALYEYYIIARYFHL